MSAALPPRWRPEPPPATKESGAFLEGYEQGLLDLEEETLHLIGRAYGPKELRVMFRSRVLDLLREVRDRQEIIREARTKIETKPVAKSPIKSEPRPASPPGIDLSPQSSAIVVTGDLAAALWLVASEASRGRKVMCIARANPGQIRASGLGQSPMLWLTGEGGRPAGDDKVKAILPTDFTAMQGEAHRFLAENRGGILFFEGYEYLKDQCRGDPTQAIRLLGALRDKASMLGGTLVACVDPAAVDAAEIGRLQKAVGPAITLG